MHFFVFKTSAFKRVQKRLQQQKFKHKSLTPIYPPERVSDRVDPLGQPASKYFPNYIFSKYIFRTSCNKVFSKVYYYKVYLQDSNKVEFSAFQTDQAQSWYFFNNFFNIIKSGIRQIEHLCICWTFERIQLSFEGLVRLVLSCLFGMICLKPSKYFDGQI